MLIPLLFLFLIALQITIAIHGRNMEKLQAQDIASRGAISGSFSSNDTFVHIYSPDPNQNLDMVITRKEKTLPRMIPGLASILGRELATDVSGVAIVENQR
ncbi:MAG: hypothetical protein F2533_00270 [Actinobacteria bacterium]|nr:hypothetical protein [Actinomycetota bacterium]MTA94316.1 hypothetical protein [Actinomycetota bacterium]MTB30650.1 hypothetical protein [Actinomycetota bacterium]